jgi:hypothetical protein
MSRHKITINFIHGLNWGDEDLLFGMPTPSHFWNNTKQSLSQSVSQNGVQPRTKSTFSLPILNMPPITPMNMTLFDSWIESFPKFNSYPKNEKKYEHLMDINLTNFKEFLYNNEFVIVSEDEATIIELLDNSVDNADMTVHLSFVNDKEKLFANKKTFVKNIDNELVYYFDNSKPSVIECKNSNIISSNNVFNYETKQSYMELHYYKELGIWVRLIKNPVAERIVPAIVVTDLDDHPLEVHCYYKNQYISNDLIKEIKPNILSENFKDDGYFDKRDIEFLDMVMI